MRKVIALFLIALASTATAQTNSNKWVLFYTVDMGTWDGVHHVSQTYYDQTSIVRHGDMVKVWVTSGLTLEHALKKNGIGRTQIDCRNRLWTDLVLGDPKVKAGLGVAYDIRPDNEYELALFKVVCNKD
jgi:hypothetical protein